MPEPVKTLYAPAARATEEEILLQVKLISELPMIHDLLDSIPALIAILNQQRQIIFANKTFTDFFKSRNLLTYLGRRPGEAISCLHAKDSEGGCGTSEACSVCGAVNAILLSQEKGSANLECRITLDNGDPLELMISTNQYKVGDSDFTIFSASDISDLKRRKSLERIFFHDVLNTTGALKGFLDILKDAPETEREEYVDLSINISEHLIEEIMAQKELTMAEDNELRITVTSFSTLDILKELASQYKKHFISIGKNTVINKDASDKAIQNDKVLLRRVLGNLCKNALEETNEGDSVTLDCRQYDGFVEFSVNNKSFIPKNIQLQIFQRSFSTKGSGRGLGTYGVKTLTERYLGGKVRFVSTEKNGTTFYIRLPVSIEK